MELTPKMCYEVAHYEGLVRQAYKDSGGVWTWGVGLTAASGVDPRQFIGHPQSLSFCIDQWIPILRRYLSEVNSAFPGKSLSEEQTAAALCFHWQTGAIRTAKWVKTWNSGHSDDAYAMYDDWWIGGGAWRERRRGERDLFWGNHWLGDGFINEYTRLSTAMTPIWSSVVRTDIRPDVTRVLGGAIKTEGWK